MYTIRVNFDKENQAAPNVIFNDVERDNSDYFPKSTFSIIYSQDFLPLKITRLCSYTSNNAQKQITIKLDFINFKRNYQSRYLFFFYKDDC